MFWSLWAAALPLLMLYNFRTIGCYWFLIDITRGLVKTVVPNSVLRKHWTYRVLFHALNFVGICVLLRIVLPAPRQQRKGDPDPIVLAYVIDLIYAALIAPRVRVIASFRVASLLRSYVHYWCSLTQHDILPALDDDDDGSKNANTPTLYASWPHGVAAVGTGMTFVIPGLNGVEAARNVRVLVGPMVMYVPLFGALARAFGCVPALPGDMESLLSERKHNLVIVPEGHRGQQRAMERLSHSFPQRELEDRFYPEPRTQVSHAFLDYAWRYRWPVVPVYHSEDAVPMPSLLQPHTLLFRFWYYCISRHTKQAAIGLADAGHHEGAVLPRRLVTAFGKAIYPQADKQQFFNDFYASLAATKERVWKHYNDTVTSPWV